LRRPVVLLATVAVALAALSPAAGGAARHKPRVTFIGDSVAGSILENPAAAHYLERFFDARFDLQVCRRLVAPSCAYQGNQPSTALDAIRARAGHLGQTVVIDVGYNDDSYGFRQGVDKVMHTLLSEGVHRVIWTTLYENGSSSYHSTYIHNNRVIRQAAKRWKQLRIADWNALCQGHSWFGSDGLHLNGPGAMALAHLLRQAIVKARVH
jgi:hypothetical protein